MNSDPSDSNPFQSPESIELQAADGAEIRPERNRLIFWSVLAAFAAIEFASAFGANLGTNRVIRLVYFATPVVALAFSSGYFLKFSGTIAAVVFKVVVAGLASVCGYLCFAFSCTATNVASGAIDGNQNGETFLFAFLSAGTMFLSCGLVALICHGVRKLRQRRMKSQAAE